VAKVKDILLGPRTKLDCKIFNPNIVTYSSLFLPESFVAYFKSSIFGFGAACLLYSIDETIEKACVYSFNRQKLGIKKFYCLRSLLDLA
jgi:hypothetical protein